MILPISALQERGTEVPVIGRSEKGAERVAEVGLQVVQPLQQQVRGKGKEQFNRLDAVFIFFWSILGIGPWHL